MEQDCIRLIGPRKSKILLQWTLSCYKLKSLRATGILGASGAWSRAYLFSSCGRMWKKNSKLSKAAIQNADGHHGDCRIYW